MDLSDRALYSFTLRPTCDFVLSSLNETHSRPSHFHWSPFISVNPSFWSLYMSSHQFSAWLSVSSHGCQSTCLFIGIVRNVIFWCWWIHRGQSDSVSFQKHQWPIFGFHLSRPHVLNKASINRSIDFQHVFKMFCNICRNVLRYCIILRAKAATVLAPLSHRNSVCPSVCPSVCRHTGGSATNDTS